VPQLRAGVIEHFAETQRDQFKMCSQPLELDLGQDGEQVVLTGTVE
jgi:hypothetical protein